MKILASLISAIFFSGTLSAKPFLLSELPPGKNITLLSSASLQAPIEGRVTVTATDSPQTLSVSVKKESGEDINKTVKIAIYDKNQEGVKYVDLNAGRVFLYNFKGLSSISIMAPQALKDSTLHGLYLQVESNKPFTVAH